MNKCENLSNQDFFYSYIDIKNNGGFDAKFSVGYSVQGKFVKENSSDLLLLQGYRIYIPHDARFIVLTVELQTIIEGWTTFYFKAFAKPVSECYSLNGTFLTPSCNKISCVN